MDKVSSFSWIIASFCDHTIDLRNKDCNISYAITSVSTSQLWLSYRAFDIHLNYTGFSLCLPLPRSKRHMQPGMALVPYFSAFLQGLLMLQNHCIVLPLQHIQNSTKSKAKGLLTCQPALGLWQEIEVSHSYGFVPSSLSCCGQCSLLNLLWSRKKCSNTVFLQLLCSNLQGQTNLKRSKVLQFLWTVGKASLRVRTRGKSYEGRKSILKKQATMGSMYYEPKGSSVRSPHNVLQSPFYQTPFASTLMATGPVHPTANLYK